MVVTMTAHCVERVDAPVDGHVDQVETLQTPDWLNSADSALIDNQREYKTHLFIWSP